MSEPLVSIVLPTFNGARFLEKSVRSCLEQTYADFELIIVDDASSDSTPMLIRELQSRDSRIRTLRHTTNRRLPGALNSGFAIAKGRYLTWTSDDNAYRPEAIATMVGYLESHPSVGMVYTDYTEIDAKDCAIRYHKVLSPENLVNGNRIGACFLYRYEVHEKVGNYAEDLFLAEDYDFWLRAAAEFDLQPLHRDCYLYRIHESSLSATKAKDVLTVTALTLLRNLPKLRWVNDRDRGYSYFKAGFQLAEAGRIAEAVAPIHTSITKYNVLETAWDFVLHRFLYSGMNLRREDEFYKLLEVLPDRTPSEKAAESNLRSQYHGAKCFEGYQRREPRTVLRHFVQALRYNPEWLRNIGLWRLVFWAFTQPIRIRTSPQ